MIVLGAGLAGLSAAVHLAEPCDVFESSSHVGGHSSTRWIEGFGFDEGAHVFFGKDDVSREFVLEPLAGQLIEHEAEIWNCYSPGRFGRYPVQLNANALPPDEATACVLGFMRVAEAGSAEMPARYDAWCRTAFGDAFAERFFLRYARKIWTVDPGELTTEWLGSSVGARITRPTLEEVVRGAIDPAPSARNYLQRFFYPREGGFQTIARPLLRRIDPARLHLDCGLVRLSATRREVTFSNGATWRFERAISTVPLPMLVAATDDAPPEVQAAAAQLRWTSIYCVNLGIRRPDVGPGHWCYFYDERVPFFRTSVPSRFSAANAPSGCSALTCEIAYSPWRPLAREGLAERVIFALRGNGILRKDDEVLVVDETPCPHGYVIFDANRPAALATIHGWMRANGIEPAGRFGEWGYHWSFEAIASGRRAAAAIMGVQGSVGPA